MAATIGILRVGWGGWRDGGWDSGGVCQTRPCTLSGPWSAGSGADTRADNEGAERQCPPLACESRGRTSRAAVFQPAPHHHPVAPTQRGPSLATAEANGKGRRCARLSKQLHSPAVLGSLSRLAVSLPRHRVAPAGPGLTGTLRWPAQWACRAGAACAPNMQSYATNMQEICRKYATNMQTYAYICTW